MNVGRLLIITGVALVIVGAIVLVAGKLNLPLGRLPGDLIYRGKNTTVYFPWVTCLVISIVFTLIMWIVNSRR
jgi:hypothetical protein